MINVGATTETEMKEKKARVEDAFGFDAAAEEYCDMFERGIIDPTKVTRSALQYASSVAGLMITTECMIAERPEEKEGKGGGM